MNNDGEVYLVLLRHSADVLRGASITHEHPLLVGCTMTRILTSGASNELL